MPENDSFALALCAPEPTAELAGKLGLYGQFVGNWEAEAQAFLVDGSTRTHFWQIRFSWVLEGRAIQDVWITPPRHGSRALSSQPWGPFTNQYGTTLRVYDPALDAWRVTWIDPAAGYRADLVGRADGDGIFQEGTGSDGSRVRWIFSDIARRSFRWRAELSRDQGASWYKAIDLLAQRV
ncbi:MAG: hypothetical protein ACM36B_10515 [Bacteroidota bacterium]